METMRVWFGRLLHRFCPLPRTLACGHPVSLMLKSAETGKPLYCELCDAQSGRRDAEAMEAELGAKMAVTLWIPDWIRDCGIETGHFVSAEAAEDLAKQVRGKFVEAGIQNYG